MRGGGEQWRDSVEERHDSKAWEGAHARGLRRQGGRQCRLRNQWQLQRWGQKPQQPTPSQPWWLLGKQLV